jgi:hypothetical protein
MKGTSLKKEIMDSLEERKKNTKKIEKERVQFK